MSPEEPVGGASRFPTTRWSAITGFHSDDPTVRARSFETLVAAYWKPVYKYVRVKWRRSIEDAQDLTQAFFLRAMEKEFFAGYDAADCDRFMQHPDKKKGRPLYMSPDAQDIVAGEAIAGHRDIGDKFLSKYEALCAEGFIFLAIQFYLL